MTELTREQIRRREELTIKLRDRTITPDEAVELKNILELEKQKAITINDIFAIGAILFLLAAVASFLSDNKKRKSIFRS
jgi:hypothetical protein